MVLLQVGVAQSLRHHTAITNTTNGIAAAELLSGLLDLFRQSHGHHQRDLLGDRFHAPYLHEDMAVAKVLSGRAITTTTRTTIIATDTKDRVRRERGTTTTVTGLARDRFRDRVEAVEIPPVYTLAIFHMTAERAT